MIENKPNRPARQPTWSEKLHRTGREMEIDALRTFLYVLQHTRDRELLSDPEFQRLLFDREHGTGLLEYSILDPILLHPHEGGRTLIETQAAAGCLVAYDFFRPEEFGKKVSKSGRQLQSGWVLSHVPLEVLTAPPEQYTPTGLYQFPTGLLEPLNLRIE